MFLIMRFHWKRQSGDSRLFQKGYFSSFAGEDILKLLNSEEFLLGSGSDFEIGERLDKVGENSGVIL